MNFENIKKGAARLLDYLDSSSEFVTGKDITETMLGEWVNEAYTEDSFPALALQYPRYFEQTATAPNYTSTSTVNATSTSTTLDVDDAIFSASTVGQYVYNSTDEEYAKITAYTDTTTVTLDKTIDNDWDGDTVYLIDKDFAFGGNATDAYLTLTVLVRATPTSDYLKAEPRNWNDAFQSDFENFTGVTPIYIQRTFNVSSTPTSGITIYPTMTTKDDTAVKITYTQKPAAMTLDADVPRLPVQEYLKWWAVSSGLWKKGDKEGSERAMVRYEMGKSDMIRKFALTASDGPVKIRPSRRISDIFNRNI